MTTKLNDYSLMEMQARILRAEAAALTVLASQPPPGLADAARMLYKSTRGGDFIVVSGAGKSGNLARRFAATLTSLGHPAVFIHPGDAAHGEFGLVQRAGAMVCLSKSGDTEELLALARAYKAKWHRLIGIAEGGQLAGIVDLFIQCPEFPEADTTLPVPNVSLACMSALCDAIALGCARLAEDPEGALREAHPGGAIGRAMR
jgi:arabinose-5-phosphate isomerase